MIALPDNEQLPEEVADFLKRHEAVMMVGVTAEGEFAFLSSFPQRDAFAVCYFPAYGDGNAQVMGLNIHSDRVLVQLLSRSAIALMQKIENHEPTG